MREVSLNIRAAECLGIVGESGSGKTQMFLAAMGLLSADARASGSVRFEGLELLGRPPVRTQPGTRLEAHDGLSGSPDVAHAASQNRHADGGDVGEPRGCVVAQRRGGGAAHARTGCACPRPGAVCASIRTNCPAACASA